MTITTQTGQRIIGSCKTFDNMSFNRLDAQLKAEYGHDNVWHKRDYVMQTIYFFTN